MPKPRNRDTKQSSARRAPAKEVPVPAYNLVDYCEERGITMQECRMTQIPAIDIHSPTTEDPKGKGVQDKETKVKKETESVRDDVREDPKGKGVRDQVLPDAIVTESVRDDVRQDSKGKGLHDQVLADTIVIPDTPEKDYPGEGCAKQPNKSSKSPISKKPKRRRIGSLNVVIEREQKRKLRKPKVQVVGSLAVKVGKPKRIKHKGRTGPVPWSLYDLSYKQSLLDAKREHILMNYNSADKEDILASMTIDNLSDPQLSGSDSEDDPCGRPAIEEIDEGRGKKVKMVAHNVYSTQPRRVYGSAKQVAKVHKLLEKSSKYQNASASKKKAIFAAKLSKLLAPTVSEDEDEDEGGQWSGNDGDDPWVVADDAECDAYKQYTASFEVQKLALKKLYGGPVAPLTDHGVFHKAIQSLPDSALPISVFLEAQARVVAEQQNRIAERKQKEQAEAAAVAAGSIPQAAAADLEAGSLQDTV